MGAAEILAAELHSKGRNKPRTTATGPALITNCKNGAANDRKRSIARSHPNGSASSGAAGTTAFLTTTLAIVPLSKRALHRYMPSLPRHETLTPTPRRLSSGVG